MYEGLVYICYTKNCFDVLIVYDEKETKELYYEILKRLTETVFIRFVEILDVT